MFTQEYTATVVKTQTVKTAQQPVYEHQFTAAQWDAFHNGVKCSLMGYTGRDLADLRGQWAKCNREAWDQGFNLAENMTARADVQLALLQRFGDGF